jgi:hypothetical protein
MSSPADRVALTVRLDPDLYKIVQTEASRTGASLGAVLTDAAKQILSPEYRKQREAEVLSAIEKCFNKLRTMETKLLADTHVLKEMIGLAVRMYLNHTPEVPEDAKEAALLSGHNRFELYLDVLAENLRRRRSVLSEEPEQEPSTPEEANEIIPNDRPLPSQ